MVHRAPESSSIPYILLAVTGVLCFAVLAVWTVSGESLSANVLHTLCGLSLVTCGTVAYTLKGRWVTVSIGPIHQWIGEVFSMTGGPIIAFVFRNILWYHPLSSEKSVQLIRRIRSRLHEGHRVIILGVNSGSHDASACIVTASIAEGITIVANYEEERFSGVKHDPSFPRHCLEAVANEMHTREFHEIDCICVGWDFEVAVTKLFQNAIENFPWGCFHLLSSQNSPLRQMFSVTVLAHTPRLLYTFQPSISPLNLPRQPMGCVATPHHLSHAHISYYLSPFASTRLPTMVLVTDGQGDDSSISAYRSCWDEALGRNSLKEIYSNKSTTDSLGWLYSFVSSTQGGWKQLSSEGRYMGAAPYGRMCRRTNPVYHRLKQLLYFAEDGKIFLNRTYANWHLNANRPYTPALASILGQPIPSEKLWDPDATMSVDRLDGISLSRLDKAAAFQMLFEDALFHIVSHLIKVTGGSNQLVWTGGCALNCAASLAMMDSFDERFYQRYYDTDLPTSLKVYVPPIPNDSGVAAGAALVTLLRADASLHVNKLKTACLCGPSLRHSDLANFTQNSSSDVRQIHVGNASQKYECYSGRITGMELLADLMSYLIVEEDCILGLAQGWSETGPRALGHRSILANACDKHALERINSRVKYREKVRPLAPMISEKEAKKLFYLPDTDGDFYNYMTLCCRARDDTAALIPAVVHVDNTSRIQVVQDSGDELCVLLLRAVGRRCGHEVLVNTSLNVASPIVHTIPQIEQCLLRATAMEGIVVLDDSEAMTILSHDRPKSGKEMTCFSYLRSAIARWKSSIGLKPNFGAL